MISVDIGEYPENVKKAVRIFWGNKKKAEEKKAIAGKSDQGKRGGATAGKNLDGFVELMTTLIEKAAQEEVQICTRIKDVTLPGYFRATKRWDIVVIDPRGNIILAIELKSLGGPSYGNNANNRCEEAIGSAVDFRTAQCEGLFGRGQQPFLAYLIFIEDDEKSRSLPVRQTTSPHFEHDSVFIQASYQEKMAILCERLVQENLYNAAVAIAAEDDGGKTGDFTDVFKHIGIEQFLVSLSCHVVAKTSGGQRS